MSQVYDVAFKEANHLSKHPDTILNSSLQESAMGRIWLVGMAMKETGNRSSSINQFRLKSSSASVPHTLPMLWKRSPRVSASSHTLYTLRDSDIICKRNYNFKRLQSIFIQTCFSSPLIVKKILTP